MMIKYGWKHFWGSFEKKAQAIFGDGKKKKNTYAEQIKNNPAHQKARERLKAVR